MLTKAGGLTISPPAKHYLPAKHILINLDKPILNIGKERPCQTNLKYYML